MEYPQLIVWLFILVLIAFYPIYSYIKYILKNRSNFLFSDLFNLPLAELWTAVVGDWDRDVEEFSEERIPIEKIILHERFHNFQHDIGKIFVVLILMRNK